MNSPKNIVLSGMRCSGKTFLGGLLASEIGWDFLDTDEYIEESSGKSVREIVAEEGWEMFREMEHQACRHAAQLQNTVIALGGGAIAFERNAQLFKDSLLLFLQVPLEILTQRLQAEGENRPDLTGDDAAQEMETVWQERKSAYLNTADAIVNCPAERVEENLPNLLTNVKKFIKI